MAAAPVRLTSEIDADRDPRAWVEEHGSPLLVLDCRQVRSGYRRLAAALPRARIHYAIKALPHAAVLATLSEEGSHFDASSAGELQRLRALGIAADRVINTNPIKSERAIRESLEYGCHTFVVDNAAEMEKFVPHRDRVSLLLRVGFRSPDAFVDLAKKFGCAPEGAFGLLELGAKLGLPIDGLSFHVGSQCRSPASHVGAINDCRALIDRARLAGVAEIRILDIGGGFPASYVTEAMRIESFCNPISRALDQVPPGVRVIAEPGRYLAAPAMRAIATVIGKAKRGGTFWYYLDDGVYGSFSGRVYDPVVRYPLQVPRSDAGPRHPSVLAGPTCDSIDIIAEDLTLPELQIGDLIVGTAMGAYSAAAASEFNSIPRTKIVVLHGPAEAAGGPIDAW